MKTRKNYTLYAFLLSFFVLLSCENDIDNYQAPDGGIYGTVYDQETNEPIPLPVQGNTGVLVNLIEQGTNATKSIDFRAKQDGSYENSRVFNGDYKVVVNGPFVNDCEDDVAINGQTQLDFKALPFSRIAIAAEVSDDSKVRVDYQVEKTDDAFNLTEVVAMWNFAPGVDDNSSNYATKVKLSTDVDGFHIFDLPNEKSFQDNLHKIKANSNRVYVRVAAKVNNVMNYSQVIMVTVR
ncbi:MAG TPA: DUF3823 domain-containing protein [Sphingobacterium sp.]|nr:DUF3823 domain-containing protein [Sphingobacterium sp.]